MNDSFHSMTDLFDQLGLPSRPVDIAAFVRSHCGMTADVPVWDAPFWTPSQACFLREKLRDDSDWALVIDSLSATLHEKPEHLPAALVEEVEEQVRESAWICGEARV